MNSKDSKAPTPDTARDLTELWELSEGGKAEWWPGDVLRDRGYARSCLSDPDAMFCIANDEILAPNQYTLDIVERHAERWLRGRGWGYDGWNGGLYWYQEDTGMVCYFDSLPAAIRAECGRGK